ncbi:MAG: 50S ribosomal protein L9 [Planctomycetota bacterium]|jgi:large subunit ribosomal protein L9
MKVLLNQDVPKLGHIGDVVDVKNGYARNYLLPRGLAVEPTVANLKAIEAARAKRMEELAREKAEMESQADAVRGREVTIAARANEEGHLYGSVGPAQIAAAMAAEGAFVDAELIHLDEPIRQLDKYDVAVKFSDSVQATIHVWVVPAHDEDGEDDSGAEPIPADADADADAEAEDDETI